jgi:hypothetical protein
METMLTIRISSMGLRRKCFRALGNGIEAGCQASATISRVFG